MIRVSHLAVLLALSSVSGFSIPHSKLVSTRQQSTVKLYETKQDQEDKTASAAAAVLEEANDALASVGWAPPREDGEMTSDDPFVQEIDAGIQRDFGVGLEELLNPAKVVNLERDLYNLRLELAQATGVTIEETQGLTTEVCDGGGGGEAAEAIRAKIDKKEKDLLIERRSVFRGWLKNVFLAQAVLSFGLSFVMATSPETLFGQFGWFQSYNMYVHHFAASKIFLRLNPHFLLSFLPGTFPSRFWDTGGGGSLSFLLFDPGGPRELKRRHLILHFWEHH